MTNLKTLLLVAVLTLGFNTIQGQSKFAHINMQELIEAMPQTKIMNDALNKLGKTYTDDITAAETALKARYEKYQAEGATQTKEENEKRQLEIEQGQRKINASRQIAQKDLSEQNAKKIEPIIEVANNAVKAVAKVQGIDYVLDSSIPTFVVTEGTDLLAAVKAYLKIQ
jgi:outer membrane protein